MYQGQSHIKLLQEENTGTFLVAQWVRTCLPMQGTRVSPHPERFHVSRNNQAHVPQLLSLHATTTEAGTL